VIFGVIIALVLEMANVPSLPFAVRRVPAAFVLGADLRGRNGALARRPPPQQAAGVRQRERGGAHRGRRRSAGVLLASGYIAGGALAGILIAFSAGVLGDFDKAVTAWSAAHNPFFEGGAADLLSLLPYAALIVLLYWMAREKAAR